MTYFSERLVSLSVGTCEMNDNISGVHLSKSLTERAKFVVTEVI